MDFFSLVLTVSRRAARVLLDKNQIEGRASQPSEQQTHQAINMMNIKDAYNVKAAKVLGVLHIICGIVALGAEIGYLDIVGATLKLDGPTFQPSLGTGIWTSAFFFISGGLAIGGARSGNTCLVVATMVMSIISAVFAGILLIISALWYYATDYNYNSDHNNNDHHHHNWKALKAIQIKAESTLGLLIAMGATMLIVAIASASIACKPLCCRSTNQDTVQVVYRKNMINF